MSTERISVQRKLLVAASNLISVAIVGYRDEAKGREYGSKEWKHFHALADAATATKHQIAAVLNAP